MRAVVKVEPAPGFVAQDMPVPSIGPDEVLIDVGAASICGSDRHLYKWGESLSAGGQGARLSFPLIPGHEVAGTVAEVGAMVSDVVVGQRVAVESHIFCGSCAMCKSGNAHLCNAMRILGFQWDGGFAECMKVPASVCFPLPAAVSLEAGALFEPVGVAVHATQRAGQLAGNSVLVCGCGPIGLYIIQLAILFGAARVVALEIDPSRRRLAERLGAVAYDPAASDPVEVCRRVAARRGGVDVAFEAAGGTQTLPVLLNCTAVAGTVVTVGHPGTVDINITRDINMRYITLKGVFGRRLWDTWELLVDLVESGRLDLEGIVTEQVGLEDFDRAFALLEQGAGKVIIHP